MSPIQEVLNLEDLEEEIDEDDNLAAKYAKNPVLTVCVAAGLVGYGIFNIVFDWLWVDDMLSSGKGLVFGPPSSAIVGVMIFIASIGTLTFILEIVNAIWKVVRGNVIVNEDLNQLLCLFLEEVPQVTLNYLLASCREVPISYYQMVKAALAMVGAAIRCLKVLIKFLTVRRREGPRGCIPFIIRIIILAACAYLLAGSIMTWIFTYSPSTNEDDSGISAPPGLISSSIDSTRYLYKAGFYLSHESFDHCDKATSNDWMKTPHNWLRIQSILPLEASDELGMQAWFCLDTNSETSFIRIQMDDVNECFQTNGSCHIEKLDDCETSWHNTTQMHFEFESIEYTKTLVFGDIRVRASIMEEQGCDQMVIDDWGLLTRENEPIVRLQYFKSMRHVNDTDIFAENGEGGGWRFFQYKQDVEEGGDLYNVTDVWKTGYDRCDMTGSLAPNPSKDKPVQC